MTAEPEVEQVEWTVRRLATHGTEVRAIAGVTVDGVPMAATAGEDGVRLWDLRDGGLWRHLVPLPAPVTTKAAPEPDRTVSSAFALAVRPANGDPPPVLYAGWGNGTVSQFWLRADVPTEEPQFPRGHHPGSWVTSLVPITRPDGTWQLASAATDGRVILSQDAPHTRAPFEPKVLRDGGLPAWWLVGLQDDGLDWLYAAVGEGQILTWALNDTGSVQSTQLDGPANRQGQLMAVAATAGRPLLAIARDDEIVVLDDPQGLIGPRAVRGDLDKAGLGTIAALHPLRIDDVEALAVANERGVVVAIDLIDGHAVGPATAVGEPVTGLGSVEVDGHEVLLVGGREGGVYVLEPEPNGHPTTAVTDAVELQDDLPGRSAADDRLRRRPLAEALATRLRRREEEGREASFLVHLDGPWGSGKTTVLNLLEEELGADWTVVRYDAWRESRIGPPWWTLLTALRQAVMRRRRRPHRRAALWVGEMVQERVLGASWLPATVLLVVLAVGVFAVFRPQHVELGETLTNLQGVVAALTALATLYATAGLVTRFFGWRSPRGAKALEVLDTNPMDRVAGHFSWLVRHHDGPIVFFVDDLDRCPAGDVVELLEAVQTLVRDAAQADPGKMSPCFVVAGDGAWIRNAFEEHYRDFAGPMALPGVPLGYLFLNKIFQLTLPVPRVGPQRQQVFFRELLGLAAGGGDGDGDGIDPALTPEAVSAATRRVEAAPHDDAQQQVLAELPQAVREQVAPTAVRRQNQRSFATATEHRLAGFSVLLPDNPRAVKRFLNAFAMTRSVRTLEGQAIPTGSLALWTILQTRWPQLADDLAAHPAWVAPGAPGVPQPVHELLAEPDVRAVIAFPDGGPLTPDLVIACRGG